MNLDTSDAQIAFMNHTYHYEAYGIPDHVYRRIVLNLIVKQHAIKRMININPTPFSLRCIAKHHEHFGFADASLQSLTFNDMFRQSLERTLDKLTTVEHLTLGYSFDQPLGDSHRGLANLRTLTLNERYDQPLGDSLQGLPNLRIIWSSDEPDTR
jgi:hypothetical protein